MSAASSISYALIIIKIDPKDRDQFLPALKDIYHSVTTDPDNFLFEVLHDDKEPGTYTLFEGYKHNVDWLSTVQPKKSYYTEYIETVSKLLVGPRIKLFLDRYPGFGHLTLPKPTQTPSPYTFFIVTIYVSSSDVKAFLDIARRTSYAGVTKEKECFILEVMQSADEPGVVRLVEGWTQSKEWCMEVQIKKPYYAPYVEETEKMWIKPREFMMLGRKDGFGYMDEEFVGMQ